MKDRSFFSNSGDLHQKLNHTIIRYKNEPVFVQTDSSEILKCHKLSEASKDKYPEYFPVDPDDPELNYASPPLGFINLNGYCLFVSRLPIRRPIQGLHRANLVVTDFNHRTEGISNESFYSEKMYKCISGIYPTFTEVLAEAKRKQKRDFTQAFDRHHALQRMGGAETLQLFHKTLQIAQADLDSAFSLTPTYNNHLVRSQLLKHGIPLI